MDVWSLIDRRAGKSAPLGSLLVGALMAAATPASAEILTFTFQGEVTAFTDTNDVYGFGAGADLTGDAVTDVYKIDTTNATFSGGQPFGPGSADNLYSAGFGGVAGATSTINGHTIAIDINNGYELGAYTQQIYLGEGAPPKPYNQSLIELQAIGEETTGTAPGTEFLIRDEAVSYSLVIPLSLTATYGLTLATLDGGSQPGAASGVFFSYPSAASPNSDVGDFNLTFGTVATVPEPATWAMMFLGFAGLGAVMRSTHRRLAPIEA